MSAEFDSALRDLARVIGELTRADPDDFATRSRLMQQRDRLRDRVAELRGDAGIESDRSTDELRRELASLEKAAGGLRKQLINTVSQAGGGRGGEMGTLGIPKLNAQISDATGLTGMEKRIQRLRSLLEDREATAG